MKKVLLILTTLFLTINLASCKEKENKPNINVEQENNVPSLPIQPSLPIVPDNEEKPTLYKDSIELFNASLEKMQTLTYEEKGFGISITKTPIGLKSLYVYEDLKHKKDELYFEKVSNGEPVMGIGVSFARKAYIKNNIGRRQDADNKQPWNPFDETKPQQSFPNVNNYLDPYDQNPSEILNNFGKQNGSYINYVINERTITNESKNYTFDNNIYKLNFSLVIDNGIDSEGLGGYKNQVTTMSSKTLLSVNTIKLEIELDKELKVIKYSSKESYVVDAGMFGITASVSNNLNYNFTYYNDDELIIKPF